jgi:DtxR family Mn-dependent transcriptional regulator
MLPSQTVENYLKTIYLAQSATADASALVPMGQLASALGVVPGTATTMMKALAESGLVHYEPYMGVRLTPSGEKLATLVLRRHRLVELFLVKVLGMSWAEVHDEAERLEHAASERLIDRMAAALEDPSHDPHGSPIPTSAGEIEAVDFTTLADAAAGDRVRIRAVDDEEPEGLRSMQAQGLVPGVSLWVEKRQGEGGDVTVRVDGSQEAGQVVGHALARRIFVTPDR